MNTSTPDGVIRFEIDDILKVDGNDRHSPVVTVRGVPWRAEVFSGDYFDVYLKCMLEQSTAFSIDVDSQFVIINCDTDRNVTTERSDTFYNDDNRTFQGETMLNREELLDEENGFVKDGKVTVEIRFWIYNMRGIRADPQFDFTDPNDPLHDVTLLINGEKVYASKQILASHSPVFKTMFFGKFAEKDKKEIELKDIDRAEFVELLHVIYPSSKRITRHSAEYLLELGDRFQIVRVTDLVEKYLIASNDFECKITWKLRLADKFNLAGLQKCCISKIKTTKEFKYVKESSIYRSLSSDMKAILFEAHLEVAK